MSGTITGPVMVLGAATEIGRDVVQALASRSRPVIAIAPDAAAAAVLRAQAGSGDPVLALVGSIDTEVDGATLAAAASRLRRPPSSIVAIADAPFRSGRLLDHPARRLADQLDAELRPHLIAARHLLPMLASTGRPASYLILGGPAAQQPWAGYGHASVGAAALRSLAQVLSAEMQGTQVRVCQLAVCSPIRTASNRHQSCPDWPNALEVGHRIADLLATPPAAPVSLLDRRRAPLRA